MAATEISATHVADGVDGEDDVNGNRAVHADL